MKKVGGAQFRGVAVSILLFADDIVLVEESHDMLQMLDVVYEYSRKYRFTYNQNKSNGIW